MAECYDLVTIGGGIHGAGIAQMAAARGWSVLVLEDVQELKMPVIVSVKLLETFNR